MARPRKTDGGKKKAGQEETAGQDPGAGASNTEEQERNTDGNGESVVDNAVPGG